MKGTDVPPTEPVLCLQFTTLCYIDCVMTVFLRFAAAAGDQRHARAPRVGGALGLDRPHDDGVTLSISFIALHNVTRS